MATPQTPQPREPRHRMEYTAGFENKMDRILEKQTALEVQLSELRASMVTRLEIDAEMEKRVSQSAYLSDKVGVENRLKHLEDAPSAGWLRAGILVSGGIGCLGLLGTCVGIVVSILVASHIIG
jgi:hypothetical protein